MRLLKREASDGSTTNSGFSLVERDAPNIPAYAILSHRWGRDEVTFKDIEQNMAKEKPGGHRKLEFCAEQCADDGLLYFWVDTCCINKDSSAELATAINSMFKWYQNATKCYVYLPDVRAGSGWEAAFLQSEWFNRGWTLQELIAPRVVEFFSVEGVKLGDKKSCEQQIHQASGVSIEVLRGKPLSSIDERERFSWTARRKTTVEEDFVYCLLGIFDVHMALIYGEGQQKALARLQREIRLQADPRLHTFQDAVWMVPFERNPLFTGRETELVQLEGKLFVKEQSRTAKIAITGLGGVGKTQLVLELLYRTRIQYPMCSILWIVAATEQTLQQSYLKMAQRLDIRGHDDAKANVQQLVQDHLSRDDAGQWLLVFDNADDVDMWTTAETTGKDKDVDKPSCRSSSKVQCLIDYLPKSRRGCIVFTTRDRKVAVKLAAQNIVTVPEMNERVATELLEKSLVSLNPADHLENMPVLLALLTYLPLAITQAAAYINANESSLADYISLLHETEEEVIDLLSEDFEDDGRYRELKNPVATTWLISFDQIRQSVPLAAEYLSFMACISPKDIPQSILPPGPSRKKELDALGKLSAYSLISRRSADAALDVHRLVHLATRNWLRQNKTLDQHIEKATKRLDEVFPDDDHRNRSVWRLYLPHAIQVLSSNYTGNSLKCTTKLMRRCAKCLSSDGRWTEAEVMFTTILTRERETLDADHPDTLATMSNLTLTYRDQGRWDEAEQLEMQVLEAYKTKLDADHPNTLTTMHNLASTYWNQGRWEEAERLQEQVLEARKTRLGADHPDTLTTMHNLALTYRDQGRWDKAEQLQEQVLEAQKTRLGADHPNTLTTMHNLALTYRDQGRWDEAEQLQEQVLEARRTHLGADHPDTLTTMHNLALTYRDQGRWDGVEQLQQQVLETRKTHLGADHPNTLLSMNNLASTYWNQGRSDEAEQLQKQVLEAQKTRQGADHPDTLTSMANLASTYCDQGRWNEAEQLEVQVLEARKTKLGADHPDTLRTMHNLAFTWESLGRVSQAIQLMEDCVERKARVLSAKHPDLSPSLAALEHWRAEH